MKQYELIKEYPGGPELGYRTDPAPYHSTNVYYIKNKDNARD